MAVFQVLIVDDQREVARMLHAALETLAHEFVVTVVPSGEEAFLEVRLKKFDLLVTDLRLPGMSGIELMNRVRPRKPETKIILITGATDTKSKKEIAAAQPDAFFPKPIEIPDFLDTVERLLGLLADSSPAAAAFPEAAPTPSLVVPPYAAPPASVKPAHTQALLPEDDEAPSEKRISERLARLRQDVKASVVIMLDDRGQVLVRAGELPHEQFENVLVPVIMASFSAGQKVSLFLGQQTPRNIQVFHGIEYDLCLAAVGPSYAMVVAAPELALDERYIRSISATVVDLLTLLLNIGVSLVPADAPPTTPFSVDIDSLEDETTAAEDEDLLALLDNADAGLAAGSLDDFWGDSASIEESSPIFDSGVITYEQALQLGLAPGEESAQTTEPPKKKDGEK